MPDSEKMEMTKRIVPLIIMAKEKLGPVKGAELYEKVMSGEISERDLIVEVAKSFAPELPAASAEIHFSYIMMVANLQPMLKGGLDPRAVINACSGVIAFCLSDLNPAETEGILSEFYARMSLAYEQAAGRPLLPEGVSDV